MRNLDYVIKAVAKEKGLPEQEVDKIVRFYWKDLKNELCKLDKPAVFVRHLGTFHMTYNLLNREILKLIRRIRNKNGEKAEYLYKYIRLLLAIRPTVSKLYYDRIGKIILEKQERNSRRNQESN